MELFRFQPGILTVLGDKDTYYRMKAELLEAAYCESDPARLLSLGRTFLGAGFLLYDRYGKNIADSLSAADEKSFPLPKEGARDLQEYYLSDPSFDSTFTTRGLTRYTAFEQFSPSSAARNLWYFNIFLEDSFACRLLILTDPAAERPELLSLLSDFSRLTADCVRLSGDAEQNLRGIHAETRRIFSDILSGDSGNEDPTPLLLLRGWSEHDTFSYLILEPMSYVRSEDTLDRSAVEYEAAFPECIAVAMEGKIHVLRNCTGDEPAPGSRFSEFLRENLLRAGISCPFSPLGKLRKYREQALTVLELGKRKAPSLWRYDLSTFLPWYAAKACLEDSELPDLCPEKLKKLIRYDRNNEGAMLTETLKEYIFSRFNATEAARKLFIHRTTFFYRLNKIQEIAAPDLTRPEEVFAMMLYFICEEYEKK